jgi:hypothetical protein
MRHARACRGYPRLQHPLQARRGWPGHPARRRASRFCPATTKSESSPVIALTGLGSARWAGGRDGVRKTGAVSRASRSSGPDGTRAVAIEIISLANFVKYPTGRKPLTRRAMRVDLSPRERGRGEERSALPAPPRSAAAPCAAKSAGAAKPSCCPCCPCARVASGDRCFRARCGETR